MAVEAARLGARAHRRGSRDACCSPPPTRPIWRRRTPPPMHAALRLGAEVAAFDVGGARASASARCAALRANRPVLVVGSDIRSGLPDERRRGQRRATARPRSGRRRRPERDRRVPRQREPPPSEFIERWRTPGDPRPRAWEERFGEVQYTSLLVEQAWREALKSAELAPEQSRPSRSSPACTPAPCGASAESSARRGVADDRTTASVTPAPRTRRCSSPTRSSRPSRGR